MTDKPTVTPFDQMAASFTADCERAANWKQNYFGAAYSTRIKAAIIELERGLMEMRDFLRKEENV